MARARLESPSRADPEGPPGSPAPAEPSALVPAASPTARQASLAWRLSLLPARGATETVPEAETSEEARPRRLDEDEKRLRREKTDADAMLRRTKNESVCSFERSSLASRVPTRRAFPSVEPSRAVTAYKTDAAIASWMEKRKQKEQGRMLLRVRRARRDLDWILTRRKAQIATCRREVKNDKADKALRAKAKREEMEKLAVAPPTDATREASSPNRQTRHQRDSREERDRESREKNASLNRFSARDHANDTQTRIANAHRDASVAAVAAHRRGSLAHVSRRGSVRDLAGFPTHPLRFRNRRGSVAIALPGDDEDETRRRSGARARDVVSRVGARTSSPENRAVRVETRSVWVAPGQFVSMRVEVPPAALTMHKNGAHREHREHQAQNLNLHAQTKEEKDVSRKHSREGLPRGSRRSSSFSLVRSRSRSVITTRARRARRSSTGA